MKVFETILGIFVGLAVLTIILRNSADVAKLASTGGSIFGSTFQAVTGGTSGGLPPLSGP